MNRPLIAAIAALATLAVLAGVLWWMLLKRSGPSPAAAPARQPGPVHTHAAGGEMVYIPPGEFMLGSTPDERARATAMGATASQIEAEGGQPRLVRITNGFWMGRTEVTAAQWEEFVREARYQTDAVRGLAVLESYPQKQPDEHPVAWVTWSDAVAFCAWLTQKEREAGRLPAGCVMRLPTEAEWEYACRGGRRGTMFWWGDSPEDGRDRLSWGRKSPLPAGSFGARGRNGFGLADMLGNVRELCLDAWDDAGAHPELCASYTRSKSRVLKGGSFKSAAADARCARRAPCPYSYGSSDIGFRVCCGADLLKTIPTTSPMRPPPPEQ
jgi:formylglycine-generating enzyme required for sulfatase activity